MQYVYFTGCMFLVLVWLLIFYIRKDLRKEMLFGGLICLPFGFTEFLYLPEYWNPPSLFNLIHRFGFGIEDFMMAFFAGSVSAVIFEFIDRKKTIKIRSDRSKHLLPYLIIILMCVILELLMPTKTVYNLAIALLSGSFIMALLRKDLIFQMISSGFMFSITYFLLFIILRDIFPDYIPTVYNLKNFWGIYLLGIPLEEIMFAFATGICWSALYEFINGYKTIRLRKTA